MEGPLLSVADVSRLTGLTRKALRHYESLGLVTPVTRTDSGYRLYDGESLRRIQLVSRAKVLGLSLAEADEFIHVAEGCCGEHHPQLAALVEGKLAETETRIEELRSLRETLQSVLQRLEAKQGQHRCEETLCTCSEEGTCEEGGATTFVTLTRRPARRPQSA